MGGLLSTCSLSAFVLSPKKEITIQFKFVPIKIS